MVNARELPSWLQKFNIPVKWFEGSGQVPWMEFCTGFPVVTGQQRDQLAAVRCGIALRAFDTGIRGLMQTDGPALISTGSRGL